MCSFLYHICAWDWRLTLDNTLVHVTPEISPANLSCRWWMVPIVSGARWSRGLRPRASNFFIVICFCRDGDLTYETARRPYA